MKTTENYEQLLQRFTKRIEQVRKQRPMTTVESEKQTEQLNYLRGCIDTVTYLMTGKLPNDGNHDGMKDHKPNRHADLDALD